MGRIARLVQLIALIDCQIDLLQLAFLFVFRVLSRPHIISRSPHFIPASVFLLVQFLRFCFSFLDFVTLYNFAWAEQICVNSMKLAHLSFPVYARKETIEAKFVLLSFSLVPSWVWYKKWLFTWGWWDLLELL